MGYNLIKIVIHRYFLIGEIYSLRQYALGMEGSHTPVGFVVLTKIESVKKVLGDSFLRIIVSFFFLILGILFFIFISKLFSIIFILPSLVMLIIFFKDFQGKKSILNSIAVNLAHPWVEEEHDVDEADVAYRMSEIWEILPRKGRVVKNLEENGLLIDGKDNEVSFQISKPLFGASILDANNEKMELEVIKWLNLALALRDAQNDVEDEIETARIREEDDGIDIERIWPKTTPGDLNVKPGAIFRKLSKAKK